MEKSNAVYGSEGEVVLSCFDGISCGQEALRRLGVKVSTYYSSEVDQHAMKTTLKNFPFTVMLGDIRKVHVNDHIDILLGGPPCTDVSVAGKGKGLIEGERSSLFFEFARVFREALAINPDLKFLVENTRMKQEYVDIISEILGVEPVLINSNLFSAQNRARLYWTNFDIPELPKNNKTVGRDIMQRNVCSKYLAGQQLIDNYAGGNQLNPSYKSQANTIHNLDSKIGCVCAGTHGYGSGYIIEDDFNRIIRKLTPTEWEKLQTLPIGYTEGVSDTQRYKGIGNGWTVDVICHIMSELKQKEV